MPPTVRRKSLHLYLDELQSKGRYTFTREQALKELKTTPTAFQKACKRLALKKQIYSPKRGFFVIIPPEYRTSGSPPPSWFIDDLMTYLNQPYCVSMLSAAANYGAAHHQPQEFQIVTTSPVAPIKMGRTKICFYVKKRFSNRFTKKVKTQTGYMSVATPELTTLDLIRYAKSSGHISHVATILKDLVKQCDNKTLIEIAKSESMLTVIQRLGYILDFLGEAKFAKPLLLLLAQEKPLPTALRPDKSFKGSPLNQKWQVWVNEKLEIDE